MHDRNIFLEGLSVILKPLRYEHLEALCQIGLEPAIWEWVHTPIYTREDMHRFIERALSEKDRGVTIPFVIIDKSISKIVGSTRFYNILPEHRQLEIGATWLAKPWQKTVINTEAKYLMLTHSFENLQYIRVQFKTDLLNKPSQRSLERIGALQEGIFRNHMILGNGRRRHSIYYSILDTEWPDVKRNLLQKLTCPIQINIVMKDNES